MNFQFDIKTEEDLLESYCRRVKPSFAAAVQRQLRYVCRVFRKVDPDTSILQYTRSTDWVSDWQRHHEQTLGTQTQHLSALRNWWNWLCENQVISDNALVYVCLKDLAEGRESIITLPSDLHRAASLYYKHLPALSVLSCRSYRLALRYYVRFVSRQDFSPADNLKEAFTQERIQNWIINQGQQSSLIVTARYVRILGSFTEFLFVQGWLSWDPFKDFLDQYPLRGVLGIVRALQSSDVETELQCLVKPPKFQSCLSQHMWEFIHWKRTMGCKYEKYENTLADFDHFLIRDGNQNSCLTKELLDRYVSNCNRLHSSALRFHLGLVRQFCIYLKRFKTDTFVPDRYWSRVSTSVFKPRIVSPDEFIRILDAIDVFCQASKYPIRRETFRTYLCLLFSSGLRPSEGLHLTIQDVNLETGILTIRDTKFYKSRLVPVSNSMLIELRDYASHRDEILRDARDSNATFFCSPRGANYSLGYFEGIFKQAVQEAAIPAMSGRRSPRLQDLRHNAELRIMPRNLFLWLEHGGSLTLVYIGLGIIRGCLGRLEVDHPVDTDRLEHSVVLL